ncbi:hypothetical protein COEREDRAFT_83589 [Coemansia reversa NRRL 1564]|uniref:SCAN box domain-containing protein n=1 Tax=Coemansia reversa (strain ATCC 12441 / NRRL 1564) TaxID=763665 RepID=A0A2G5B2R4_COERN|nr:hypothetical protein COEREDRAFT_83589 [Coemansia reversa NRRL 1564]|eukprot:PIA13296.1 hypothetical protein COEREDRAFT_83589 [Coemansia reversa NRRL 1564]
MTDCLTILGELRQLVYEWKYQYSNSSKSAEELLLLYKYLQIIPKEHTKLRAIQIQTVEDRLSELQRDLRSMVEISKKTIILSKRRLSELTDGYERVLGITPLYVDKVVSSHAEEYKNICSMLMKNMRNVIDTFEYKKLAEDWLSVDFLKDDFEERLLLLAKAKFVRSTREEEKRLGLS